MKYDVAIVGAGPSGYFCAYELVKKNPELKVILLDKGLSIENRHCPVLEHKLTRCPKNAKGYQECFPACSITNGFGGAGAYSDGKFNITAEFGGWLQDYIDQD
ncbi:MAG: NAD(P)-binding protein, partial [Bacilli bacterium]|nr:NAD(P)-binding protein [Bacilli bacterium]